MTMSKDTKIDILDESMRSLINLVGIRVLEARKAKSLSRRQLSEISGVSQRYLVQLEGGEGNISIGLLHRISIALEHPIEWLVRSDDAFSEDLDQLIVRYQNADASTREQVRRLLEPEKPLQDKMQRIGLIGLRGAGKSTLGALLGEKLNIPFIELNQEIQQNIGMPISDVIAMYGTDGFRKLEANTLQHVISTHERVVLAVAGGVVEDESTFTELLARFNTVWLQASPMEHMERVQAQGDFRPMADNPQAMDQLREILNARTPRYAKAELHVDTSGKSVHDALTDLLALISSQNIYN